MYIKYVIILQYVLLKQHVGKIPASPGKEHLNEFTLKGKGVFRIPTVNEDVY